jgi:hypothetical protein
MATNIRWQVRRALAEILGEDDDLTGIDIFRGWPGDLGQREYIWLGPSATTGSLFTGPDFEANPVNYDDEFTVPVHIFACAPGQDLDQAEDRGEQLYLAVERVVRTKPLLASYTNGIAGLKRVIVADLSITTANFHEGVGSLVDVTLSCKSRISGGAS